MIEIHRQTHRHTRVRRPLPHAAVAKEAGYVLKVVAGVGTSRTRSVDE